MPGTEMTPSMAPIISLGMLFWISVLALAGIGLVWALRGKLRKGSRGIDALPGEAREEEVYLLKNKYGRREGDEYGERRDDRAA